MGVGFLLKGGRFFAPFFSSCLPCGLSLYTLCVLQCIILQVLLIYSYIPIKKMFKNPMCI